MDWLGLDDLYNYQISSYGFRLTGVSEFMNKPSACACAYSCQHRLWLWHAGVDEFCQPYIISRHERSKIAILTYIMSSLFKLTVILAPLMLSHLLVHLPPRPLRSQIALFSMPPLISGINFHFHFVNQFHLFMLTLIHPSVLHSPHPSPLHSKLKTYLIGKSFSP